VALEGGDPKNWKFYTISEKNGLTFWGYVGSSVFIVWNTTVGSPATGGRQLYQLGCVYRVGLIGLANHTQRQAIIFNVNLTDYSKSPAVTDAGLSETVANAVCFSAWCLNKKLSYRRWTARRAMLVNSCYVSRGMGDKVSDSKSDLQGHSVALAMVYLYTGHIWFTVRLPLQPCSLFCTVSEILTLFTKTLRG